jgi:hypothetical protein
MLAALGSVAVGGATAVSTGAFTSVEADRDVTIEVAGDAGAFLSISKATDADGNVYPNAEEYVHGDPSSGVVSLNFASSSEDATGINEDAKTVFDNLLDIENQGSQEVKLSIDSDLIASQGGSLGVYAENELGDGGEDNTGLSDAESGQTAVLGVGDVLANVGVYVPKGSSGDVSDGTLTFVAERTGGNRD